MRRILIADDDFPIRDWLTRCCREILKDKDIEISAVGNGDAAYSVFLKETVDILFVDIKMPVMDGLQLTERINENGWKVYTVVLSSYDDFNYARTAFKNNVNEYVLKTEITTDYMRNILDRALQWVSINKEGEGSSGIYTLENLMEGMSRDASKEEKMSYLAANGIKPPSGAFFCVADHGRRKTQEGMKIIQEDNIQKVFSMKAGQAGITCFTISGVESMLYRFQKVNVYIKKLAAMNGSHIICYGRIGSDFENILYYAEEVYRGLGYRFYSDESVFYAEAISGYIRRYNSIDKAVLDSYAKIVNTVDKTNFALLRELISQWVDTVNEYKVLDISFVRHMAQKICSHLEVWMSSEDISGNINVIKKIEGISKVDELKAIIIDEYMSKIEHTLKDKANSSVIQSAIKYIYANYAQISGLSEVAEHVGLSKEYFSRLFKEETGVNFSVYLNDYRLDAAKDMLLNTDKKLYEIAEETGFSSLSYFSRKFKERFNHNPFAYRK